ncbi:MAG TPA: hypothetical protein DD640_03105 [Clostridiales bacterium]|nr:hypothetical protein [Clostridiales bacterium]
MVHQFGGMWTIQKLDKIGKYINAYAEALKKHHFRRIYIDAFAGTGSVDIKVDGKEITIDGSARIALSGTCPFDEYIFVEQNSERAYELLKLKNEYPGRNIKIYSEDCNEMIQQICRDRNLKYSRVLLFLDHYSTEVAWSTIKEISATDVIDLWYLFPLSAMNRMMPKNGRVTEGSERKLNSLFGDDTWKNLYQKPKQISLFENDEDKERQTNNKQVIEYIYNKLNSIFEFVIDEPMILRNSKNSPLFALFFAMTNQSPKAKYLARKLATEILNS